MATTLTELAYRYGFPFVARHVHSDKRYLVKGYSDISDVIFKVVEVPELQDVPFDDTPEAEVYGGYEYWRYEKKLDRENGISPEAQKKAREEERKRNNERAIRQYRLKAGDSPRSQSRKAPPKKPIKDKEAVISSVGTVIEVDFTKKNH